jgi:hypothetical protein
MRYLQIMRQRNFAMLIVLVLLSLACGVCVYLPSPSDKAVTRSLMAGTYEYEYQDKTVTVYLGEYGDFSITNSNALEGNGKWFLDGSDIVLLYNEKESEYEPGWYVSEYFGEFKILGGEGDADYWIFFKKLAT